MTSVLYKNKLYCKIYVYPFRCHWHMYFRSLGILDVNTNHLLNDRTPGCFHGLSDWSSCRIFQCQGPNIKLQAVGWNIHPLCRPNWPVKTAWGCGNMFVDQIFVLVFYAIKGMQPIESKCNQSRRPSRPSFKKFKDEDLQLKCSSIWWRTTVFCTIGVPLSLSLVLSNLLFLRNCPAIFRFLLLLPSFPRRGVPVEVYSYLRSDPNLGLLFPILCFFSFMCKIIFILWCDLRNDLV